MIKYRPKGKILLLMTLALLGLSMAILPGCSGDADIQSPATNQNSQSGESGTLPKTYEDCDYYDHEGVVEAIDYQMMQLTVYGETFFIDDDTVFDIDDCYLDYPTLHEVYVGDYVKVEYCDQMENHGYYARKVQVIRDYDYYDVEGQTAMVDHDNRQFMVYDYQFWADDCTEIVITDQDYATFADIRDGDYVKVEYRSEMDGMGYYAKKIEVYRYYDYYDVEGYVEAIDLENMLVVVMGQSYYLDGYTEIDIDDCYLDYPTLAEIRVGDMVKITYRTPMDEMGFYAQKIQVIRDYDYRDVMGYIEMVDHEAMTLMVNDTQFWADACTELQINKYEFDAFDQLMVGDFVKIEYRFEMDETLGYYAKKIEVEDFGEDDVDDEMDDD